MEGNKSVRVSTRKLKCLREHCVLNAMWCICGGSKQQKTFFRIEVCVLRARVYQRMNTSSSRAIYKLVLKQKHHRWNNRALRARLFCFHNIYSPPNKIFDLFIHSHFMRSIEYKETLLIRVKMVNFQAKINKKRVCVALFRRIENKTKQRRLVIRIFGLNISSWRIPVRQ